MYHNENIVRFFLKVYRFKPITFSKYSNLKKIYDFFLVPVTFQEIIVICCYLETCNTCMKLLNFLSLRLFSIFYRLLETFHLEVIIHKDYL